MLTTTKQTNNTMSKAEKTSTVNNTGVARLPESMKKVVNKSERGRGRPAVPAEIKEKFGPICSGLYRTDLTLEEKRDMLLYFAEEFTKELNNKKK